MSRVCTDVDKYPLTANLNVDPRLVGGITNLIPMPQFVSSQRIAMFNKNITQHLVINGSEPQQVTSGYASEFSKYTFNTSRLPQDAKILSVVPKYRERIGTYPIAKTPKYTVIYFGMDDNKIHSMEVSTYTAGTDGFGYENLIDYGKMRSDTFLEKNDVIYTSNSVDGEMYNMGVNANVCYLSMQETTLDAFCISESLAKRLESTGYKTVTIQIDKNTVPRNLYGDDVYYKFFPDIGDRINPDGVICGLQDVRKSYLVDLSPSQLNKYQPYHGDSYFSEHRDAVVVDVDVRINRSKKIKTPDYIFEQVEKYDLEYTHYCRTILEKFDEYCVKGKYQCGDTFNSLVTRAGSFLLAKGERPFGLHKKTLPLFSRKSIPMDFIEVTLVYKFTNHVSIGYKITNSSGAKGTVSRIYPDWAMPKNDYGITADIIASPETLPKRMNLDQSYEQFINLCSYFVLNRMKDMDPLQAYEYMLEFIGDVNPAYAGTIQRAGFQASDQEKIALVQYSIDNEMIILVIPPFLNTLNTKWCEFMEQKYQVYTTPLTYTVVDKHNNPVRVVRTKNAHMIGKRYIFVLCKIPHQRSSAMGFVNQFGIPIKIKYRKDQYPMLTTPIRFGEDENRNMIMVLGTEHAYRMLSLYANSPESTGIMVETLLTAEQPSNLYRVDISTEDLVRTNRASQISNHLLHTAGIDMMETSIESFDIDKVKSLAEGC